MLKFKVWFMRIFIILLVGTVIALLFQAKILYYKIDNMSFTVGVSGKYDNETVRETLSRGDKEIRDADLLIEDARRRDILD